MRRQNRQKRILITMLVVMPLFIASIVRLFLLQVVHGPEFAKAAVIQRSLRYVYATGRGQILDRNGESLLGTDWRPALVSFEPILEDEVKTVIGANGLAEQNLVQVITDPDLVEYISSKGYDGFMQVEIEERYGPRLLAPHVTGFVQRDETVHERPPFRELTYRAQSGLELFFDDYLSASRPATLAVMLDAQKRIIKGLGFRTWQDTDPSRPYNVVTTIDRGIQAAVENIGSRYLESGAIVVVDPKTGDILAMASFPGYSPADMLNGLSPEDFKRLAQDPRKPFINRAIAAYPPGSVFKVVLAAAALEQGFGDHRYFCEGTITVGDREVSCYNRRAHGSLDLKQALAESCNTYFIDLGQKLGRQVVLEYARKLGLGETVGIPLYGEAAGNIPAAEEIPFLGDLANVSIGQGAVTATPLQLARLMTVFAAGGRDFRPRLVTRVLDSRGKTVQYFSAGPGSRVLMPQTVVKLTEMMKEVTLSGTAQAANSHLFAAAGKSGTAQTGRAGEDTYTWFCGLAPLEEEPLVITVFAEERKGNTAAGIFREVAETLYWMRKN